MKGELFGALEAFEGKVLIIMEVRFLAYCFEKESPSANPMAFLLLRFRFALSLQRSLLYK